MIYSVGPEDRYNHYELQILRPRYADTPDYFDVVGKITWQSNADAPDNWYGRTYRCETDRLDNLEYFTKVIKRVKDCWNPSEVHEALNSVRYKTYAGIWYPETEAGFNVYDVLKFNEAEKVYEDWSCIVAEDVKQAHRRILKRYKLNKSNALSYTIKHEPRIVRLA